MRNTKEVQNSSTMGPLQYNNNSLDFGSVATGPGNHCGIPMISTALCGCRVTP